MRLIVGLGNPGKQYETTRHNVGFMALDAYALEKGLSWETNKKFNALIIKDGDNIFLKPQTFMNLSGDSVQAAASFYKINPKADNLPANLIVIHDDLDINLGEVRISVDSRAAGHNGVQSIIDDLGTKNFTRIRVGIKMEMGEKIPAEKFVLEKFRDDELETIKKLISEIIKKIKTA